MSENGDKNAVTAPEKTTSSLGGIERPKANERREPLAAKALTEFDSLSTKTKGIKGSDVEFAQQVGLQIGGLKREVANANPKEISVGHVRRQMEQVAPRIGSALLRVSESADKLGASDSVTRKEIEDVLKELTQKVDSEEMTKLSDKATELFNRTVQNLKMVREATDKDRNGLRQTANSNYDFSRQLYSRTEQVTPTQSENSLHARFRAASKKLTDGMEGATRNLHQKDKKFLLEAEDHQISFKKILDEILHTPIVSTEADK